MNNKISLQAQKENSILIWNDRVGKRERQSLGHEIKSMYNPEQEELLKEYKSKFPSGYNRIDPATGDIIVDQNNNPVTYKYQPPNFNITLDTPQLQQVLSEQDVIQHKDAINQYLNEITKYEQEIITNTDKINTKTNQINSLTVKKEINKKKKKLKT